MAELNGTGGAVDVAPGYRIVAPGLLGTVTARERRPPGALDRGPELITPAFDHAMEAAGLREVMNLDLAVRQVPVPPSAAQTRTVAGEDAFVLETPDLGADVGQVVLAVDGAGAVTWSFPETSTREIEPPRDRGAGGVKRFVVRWTAPPQPQTDETERGLFGAVGRTFLKVLVYPVTDAVLGPVTEHFARAWETRQRPYTLRPFRPEGFRVPSLGPLTGPEWEHLGTGPALLFVHGTISTSHGGFGSLPIETMTELYRRYHGRVFAFDHFTLSHSPEENVAELAARMPDGMSVEVDVVSHSRGGLVSRVLAGELDGGAAPGLSVRRAVFVATPNHGTALADADHMIAFIDRYTSILNLAPPGPLQVVSEILEAIVTIVKIIGSAALHGLEGLMAMDPRGDLIERLDRGRRPTADYYAIAADYRPTGALLSLVAGGVANAVIDRVFGGTANDLVVPTLGVSQGSTAPAPLVAGNRAFTFPDSAGVLHTSFFGAPETTAQLLSWLPG
ncbi:hypothetical protein [Sanguibacter sp. 25GB23B1]|uniref:esterase/lipase family protein n=1 Tax=unclassified Sanguibacter TaxID=2645534 RepID=UPI0032AF57D8